MEAASGPPATPSEAPPSTSHCLSGPPIIFSRQMEEESNLSLLPFAQLSNYRKVFERRRIALYLARRCQLAQEPPHDLAAPRLRERIGEPQIVRPSQRANLLGNPLSQFLPQLLAGLVAGL